MNAARPVLFFEEVVFLDRLKEAVGRAAKRVVKAGAKKLVLLLLPYLAPLIPFLVVFFMITVMIAATYASMAPGGYMTGVNRSPEDEKIQKEYQQLCGKYNVADTWLVNPGEPSRPGGPSCESSPGAPFYPNGGKGYLIGEMVDRYRQDIKLKITWGQVHGACLFRNYVTGESEITGEQRDKTAKDLHPYFYYKESVVIVSSKDGTEVYPAYLLVEAYTIQGHYQYHYEWITETHGEGENAYTITYERLRDAQQILPDKWQRLKTWIKREYNLKDDADEVELARMWLWEAAQGFDERKEWLKWLLDNFSYASYVSSAMIPPELMPFFKEAEQNYGIPWWFLAAVAFKESSFSPQAENQQTHCYGLMQVSPENWRRYAPQHGFEPILDKDNPRAQIMVGAFLLKNLFGGVDWEGDWKEDTLDGLAFYGGYRGSDALERCRREYAGPIWELAGSFRSMSGVWPVPGHTTISSPYGWRIHPVTGKKTFHDGIDIPAPQGTPVMSVSSGVVILAGANAGYGNCVIVKDAQHEYLYGHLSRIDVSVNQTIKPGDGIGAVGSTGVSTGPHLHFGVMDLARNEWIDPLLVVQP